MATRRQALWAGGSFLLTMALPASAGEAGRASPAPPVPVQQFDGVVNLLELEPLAREHLAHMAFEYICGGAAARRSRVPTAP